MSPSELLRTLVGSQAGPVDVFFSPPAPGWRGSLTYLARREVNRLRSVVRRKLEPVVWAASPGLRPRYPSLRQAILGGHIRVDLPESAPIRIVQRTTGFVPMDKIRVGSGGGIRQLGRWHDRSVLARLGTVDTPGDPLRHFQALEQLALRQMPEALETGVVDGVRWTIESFIDGRPSKHVTPPMASMVTAFLAGLPPGTGPVDVVGPAELLSADTAIVVKAIVQGIEDLPSVTAHGDLWSGNLLFRDEALVGVIDWDSWQDRAVPGTDLLHLWAEDMRRADGLSYGDLVGSAFWADHKVSQSLDEYLSTLGVTWNSSLHPVLGASWWLRAVTGALARNPLLSADPGWMARNVHQAIETFDRHFT